MYHCQVKIIERKTGEVLRFEGKAEETLAKAMSVISLRDGKSSWQKFKDAMDEEKKNFEEYF